MADERDEIEITPEMMQAGLLCLAEYSPTRDDAEGAVWSIYDAMERARVAPAP